MRIFDVSKYNYCYPVQIVLSAPLVALAILFLTLFWIMAALAMLIGRRPAFRVLYDVTGKVLHD